MKRMKYIFLLILPLLLWGCSNNKSDQPDLKKSSGITQFEKLDSKDQKKVSITIFRTKNEKGKPSFDAKFINNTTKTINLDLAELSFDNSDKDTTNTSNLILKSKEQAFINDIFVPTSSNFDPDKFSVAFIGNSTIKLEDREQTKATQVNGEDADEITDNSESTSDDGFKASLPKIDSRTGRKVEIVSKEEMDAATKEIDLSHIKESDWKPGIPPFLNGTYRSEYLARKYIMMNFNQAKHQWSSYLEPASSRLADNYGGDAPSYIKVDKSTYFMRELNGRQPYYMKIIYIDPENNIFLRGPIMGELKDDKTNANSYKYHPEH